jgi:hypothetical protein
MQLHVVEVFHHESRQSFKGIDGHLREKFSDLVPASFRYLGEPLVREVPCCLSLVPDESPERCNEGG